MFILKTEELAGALDAFAEHFPKANIRVLVGERLYHITSQVMFDTVDGKDITLIADVDGNAK